MSLKVTINGKVYEAQSGEYILDVCRRNDIYVPTLCHHDGLPGLGSCRLCVVEINEGGSNKVVVSCVYPLNCDCKIYTDSEKIIGIQRTILSMLKARAPDCEEIIFLCLHYGVRDDGRFSALQKSFTSSCILCGLCAQACASLGSGATACCAISTTGRGTEKKVSTPYDESSADCIGCASCASVCPVSAIECTEANGKRSIWERDFSLVNCASCGKSFATSEEYALSLKKAAAQDSGTSEGLLMLCDICKRKKAPILSRQPLERGSKGYFILKDSNQRFAGFTEEREYFHIKISMIFFIIQLGYNLQVNNHLIFYIH
ncbi:MAG: (2Fe-2S)-binding protein [Treponema sp.]|jgi:formate hydrogenlyase subunit 6/NADH:ubiquinone oxidoreductase subunit I/ferredoxin|nr:(2Fe-2S)-binding protein [Treponema sp.]